MADQTVTCRRINSDQSRFLQLSRLLENTLDETLLPRLRALELRSIESVD